MLKKTCMMHAGPRAGYGLIHAATVGDERSSQNQKTSPAGKGQVHAWRCTPLLAGQVYSSPDPDQVGPSLAMISRQAQSPHGSSGGVFSRRSTRGRLVDRCGFVLLAWQYIDPADQDSPPKPKACTDNRGGGGGWGGPVQLYAEQEKKARPTTRDKDCTDCLLCGSQGASRTPVAC